MNTALLPTRRDLAHGEILRIPHSAGVHVACHSGSVWITEQADSRDQVLAPGETAQLERPGTSLVYALAPSVVLVERHAAQPQPAPSSAAARFGGPFSDWLATRWSSPLHAFARWS
jgi:hypothetical protein